MFTRRMITPAIALALLLSPALAHAQTQSPPASPQDASAQATQISDAQLAQALAPVALYPDTLLAQVLMASTYPVEIVEADRWAQANKNLKGDALALALQNESWDASVKSLINFPSVLSMLSTNLSSTTVMGDAFLADQARVMKMVQTLRAKAKDAGNLKTSSQQTVTLAQSASGPGDITIAPTNPDVIYVPTYDPNYYYGTWPYPAYVPYYYNPGYAWYMGYRTGPAWGYAWGYCNWGNSYVYVNVHTNSDNHYAIDRSQAENWYNQHKADPTNPKTPWQHNPDHRDGVPYANQSLAQKFNNSNLSSAESRSSFRGREDIENQQIHERAARGEALQAQQNQQARERNYSGSAFSGVHEGQREWSSSYRGNYSRNTERSYPSYQRFEGQQQPARQAPSEGSGRRR